MAETKSRLGGPAVAAAALDRVVVRLRLIGQMEAWTVRNESVLPAGKKTRALLAVIAMAAPRQVPRGRLAEQLWSRRPEEQARASLRQEIHRLVEALSPAGTEILIITRDHLALRPGAVWLDVEEVMQASIEQPASLALLDGDLLDDLDGIDPNFDAWLSTERERLRDQARGVAEALLKGKLQPDAAASAAQRLLSIDRSHEGAWRALMRAHAARGERGLAVQAYDRCSAALADLLDAAPSPETQLLLREIRGLSGSRPLAGAGPGRGGMTRGLVRPAPMPRVRDPGEAAGAIAGNGVGAANPAAIGLDSRAHDGFAVLNGHAQPMRGTTHTAATEHPGSGRPDPGRRDPERYVPPQTDPSTPRLDGIVADQLAPATRCRIDRGDEPLKETREHPLHMRRQTRILSGAMSRAFSGSIIDDAFAGVRTGGCGERQSAGPRKNTWEGHTRAFDETRQRFHGDLRNGAAGGRSPEQPASDAIVTGEGNATPAPESPREPAAATAKAPDPERRPNRERPQDPSRDRPAARRGSRIGVLPLRLAGIPAEDALLGPGLADEISIALSRFRCMFVVSASSLSRYITDQRDEAAIRREFGLDFLLDGSVQRAGATIRVSLRLLDVRNANQIVWAQRFDREAADLLSLQDEIAAEVVARIDPAITLIEASRSIADDADGATAYNLVLRALSLMGRLDLPSFRQSGQYLAEAIAMEPDYASAYSWYAWWHALIVGQDWTEQYAVMSEKAGELADRSIILDPYDARAATISGHVQAFLRRRPRDGMGQHERALTLNPNLAMAWALSSAAHAYAGDQDEAERRYARYKKLSPLDPHAFFFDTILVLIHLLRREYETAADIGRNVIQINPSFSAAYKPYLAALGHLGQHAEAATVRRRLLMIEPEFSVERFLRITPIERCADREQYAEGLRLAGVRQGNPPAGVPILLQPGLR